MKKSKFTKFIDKYYLAGIVESVRWVIENKKLKTQFYSDDRTLIGMVSMDDFDMEDSIFGIYKTSNLLKRITALDEDCKVKVDKNFDRPIKLQFKDPTYKVDFVLADESIIPETSELKKLPDFELSIEITKDFIQNFIKGRNAIDSDYFAIQSNGDETTFILGYSDNNTDRISFKVETKSTGDLNPIIFNADIFKNILMANKDFTAGKLFISEKGLIRLQFIEEGYISEYFLVELQLT